MSKPITEQIEMPWQKIVDTLHTPVMVLDTNLIYRYANPAYCQLVSKNTSELIGMEVFEVFPESAEVVAEMRRFFHAALAGETVRLDEQPYKIANANGVMEEHYWRILNRPVRDESGQVKYMLQEAENITREREASRQRDVISNELDHRVKNLLAVINAIINLSGTNSDTVPEFRRGLAERFQAISRAHERLAKSDWKGLEVEEVLRDTLKPFCDLDSDKVTMRGPPVKLAVRATRDASMLFHEFATNAAKYGFLSEKSGRLDIEWTIDPETRTAYFTWTESGLTGIETPTQSGFGSLLTDSFPNLNVTKDYRPEGLQIKLTINEEILALSQSQLSMS